MRLLEQARSFAPDLVALRRDLHRHPELSFQEHRTAGKAARAVGDLGWTVRTGVGRTGVIAELGAGSGPTVALRADMDALPIQEEAEHDYGSTVPGVMHACGHDAHVAGLVGAARLLTEAHREGRLAPGTVRLLFQPSEETVDDDGWSGATRMIEDGAMEGVDAVVGLHVGGSLPAGRVFVRPGTSMAGAREIRAEVRGRSAHAARPNQGVDALVLAAGAVLAAQQAVSRGLSPMETGVVHFGRIEGGSAPNVLADRVSLGGTMRWFTEEVRDRLEEGVRRAFRTADALGGGSRVDFLPGYPPVVNDPDLTRRLRRVWEDLLGSDRVLEVDRMMEAEDFGILAREAPGVFVWVGAAPAEPRAHHHPRFDIDESALPVASAVLAAAAEAVLRDGAAGSSPAARRKEPP